MSYIYPGSRWFLGRNRLTTLMASSYITFGKVLQYHKIPTTQWKLNGQQNYIENQQTGSRIDLLDLQYLPSDPYFERYGSREYTGGWIEEASEVDFMAFDVLKSRIGRHNVFDKRVPSKMLITCNPKKNWLYSTIYKPWKESRLPKEYAFIQSLYGDNPYVAETYGKELFQLKDEASKQRLMFGNWEYDDDEANLIEYDAILALFTNTLEVKEDKPSKYLIADIARLGQDKTVIGTWEGFKLNKPETIDKSKLDFVETRIRDILLDKRIPYSNALGDEDGLGGGVVDNLHIKGFVNNSSPLVNPETFEKMNFKNLKTQCAYMLADKINKREMVIDVAGDEKLRQTIIEELEQLKAKDPEKDESKLQIVPKDEIKANIGRSPDYLDMLIMRMYFELVRPEGREEVVQYKPNYSQSNYGRRL